ncbi:MAG: hypothetical protein ACR2QC_08010 [Gammaproteobacteria bacterium]
MDSPHDRPDTAFPPIGTAKQPDDPPADSVEAKLAASQSDLAATQKRIAELEARDQERTRTIDRLIQREPSSPAEPLPPQDSLPELPNITEDPKGYAEALQTRVANAVSSTLEEEGREADAKRQREDGVTNLWKSFAQRYPALAKDSLIVKAVANEEFGDMRAAGFNDPIGSAIKSPDSFLDKIAAKTRAAYEERNIPITEEPGTPNPSQPTQRTVGVGGGRSGNSPASVATPPNDGSTMPEGSFIKDLAKLQVESGFY